VTTDRVSRSHSQLSTYLHCGWEYRLKKIAKVTERPSVWLPGGSAFHTTTEAIDHATWEIRTADELTLALYWPTWEEEFDRNFEEEIEKLREQEPDETRWRTAGRTTKDKPNGEDVAWWRAEGRAMVGRYLDWKISTVDTLRIAAVKGAPGIEVEVTVPVGGVPMRGFIDRVLEDPKTGVLMVMDLKTGSRTPDSPLQLALYSVQLEEMLGRSVTYGAFWMARKGVLTDPIDLSVWTNKNLGIIYRSLDSSIEQGLFLPNITSMCGKCGVREHCLFQGGKDPLGLTA
jgi:putative RecB family exonuclease